MRFRGGAHDLLLDPVSDLPQVHQGTGPPGRANDNHHNDDNNSNNNDNDNSKSNSNSNSKRTNSTNNTNNYISIDTNTNTNTDKTTTNNACLSEAIAQEMHGTWKTRSKIQWQLTVRGNVMRHGLICYTYRKYSTRFIRTNVIWHGVISYVS